MQRLVRVDGKVRTDATYPAGFMDVIDIEKTDEHFRLIYDSKGRFVTHRITKVCARDLPCPSSGQSRMCLPRLDGGGYWHEG
jgi:ribosomal protein S4E